MEVGTGLFQISCPASTPISVFLPGRHKPRWRGPRKTLFQENTRTMVCMFFMCLEPQWLWSMHQGASSLCAFFDFLYQALSFLEFPLHVAALWKALFSPVALGFILHISSTRKEMPTRNPQVGGWLPLLSGGSKQGCPAEAL